MDAKIDKLHQAGLLGAATKPVEESESHSESEIEDIVADVRCLIENLWWTKELI